MTPSRPDIILASASPSRRKLLEAAGVEFRAIAAGVDENAIKRRHDPQKNGFGELAAELASRKALAVADRHTGALVIQGETLHYDTDLCLGCGLCVELCPREALSLYLDETKPQPLDVDRVRTTLAS